MSGHTPGPWEAFESTEKTPFPAGVPVAVGTVEGEGAQTSIICEMVCQGGGKYDPAETEANAHLIAAAPALRDALEKVDRYFSACAKAWSANEGRVVTESGQPCVAADGLDRLAEEAGAAARAALAEVKP